MIVSATGPGKTITAGCVRAGVFSGRADPGDRGHLDLLAQTAQAWRLVGHRSGRWWRCSLEKAEVLSHPPLRTTTYRPAGPVGSPAGRVVVFATYAPLVDREDCRGPLGRGNSWAAEAALAGGERLYGQQMSGFDLAIVDEAHSTAGDLGRPWAAIHDNARHSGRLPALLTATPRILAAPRPQQGPAGELEIASMADDVTGTYGAWLAEPGPSEAIERGILAGFEIDVLEIRDPPRPWRVGGSAAGRAPGHGCRPHCWSTRRRTTCVRS